MTTAATDKPFLIYRSSAGSGKTYTLAREYILLALRYPGYFRHVLAVTFTNKATAEMKDRIITNLHLLSQGEGKGLRAELRQSLSIADAQLTENARQSLEALLHDYSHFSVSTIDKFFQRVLRAFAREVGLQGGVTLELDQEKVLNEIIDSMLMEVGDNPELTHWLTEFAEDKLQNGKAWDIRKDISSLGRELFKERFKVVAPLLQEVGGDEKRVQDFLKGVQELMARFENTIKGFIDKFKQVMDEHGLTVADFSRGGGGPAGLFAKFAKKEFDVSDTRMKAIDNPDSWITKTTKIRPQLEAALEGGIMQAYAGMIDYFGRNIVDYNTADQARRYLYTLGIVADLSRKLGDYRDEEEVMLISDAPDFLQRIIGNNDTPWIYEKSGTFYRHYLIDEFQDTSGFQWKNFKPLVENSLSQGYKNLVVGDVKQSIYRWRGGDAQLLLHKVAGEIGDHYTLAHQLKDNWRSYANIIRFNNELFQRAPALLSDVLIDDILQINNPDIQSEVERELGKLQHAYHEAAQGQGNEDKVGGQIRLQWMEHKPGAQEAEGEEEEESDDWQEKAIKETVATIETLQTRYALRDICILVRKADEGRRVAKALLEKKEAATGKLRYDVISPESLYLGASPVVRLLLSAFRHLYNPTDTLSKAQLVYEYHHFLSQGQSTSLPDLFIMAGDKERKADFEKLLPPELSSEQQNLLRVPLQELAERLIGLFGLTAFTREFPYLQGFQDALLEFSKNNRGDVGTFLRWWEETGARRSIQVPEEQDAIRIMTIHKAKGLEFKAVIVPFCSWDLDQRLEEVLWCKAPDVKPFDRLPFYPVRYSSKLANTHFAGDYFREKMQFYLDNLNLLYVALTRPEEVMHIFAPLPNFRKEGGYGVKKVSDVLYQLFLDDTTPPFAMEPMPQVDTEGHQVTIGNMPPVTGYETAPRSTVKLQNYLSTNWRQRLSIRLQGGTLDPEQREKSLISTRRGTVYHRLLSQIKTTIDLGHVFDHVLPLEPMESAERKQVQAQLEKLFTLPEMQVWYGGGWEVRTESPVLPTGGDIRRFDRVLLKGSEAVLIEFKTGMPSPAHHRQAAEYTDLLLAMGYTAVKGYLVYIDQLTIQPVA